MDDSSNVKGNFLEGLNSSLHVKAQYDSKELNYTWVELFEECIPYIDNILRNPKKFIVNEEEVVKVEKAKKITVESVIHLTQHTNLIEDYNFETGDVRPSQILQINKEESVDTYENRFIHTLIKNMDLFYMRHVDALSSGSYYVDSKNAEYEATTKIGNEDVKMSVKYSSLNKNKTEDRVETAGGGTDSLDNRLKAIKVRLDGFAATDLMKSLDKQHVAAVSSPIRKTNAILKNPNFQKATQLWNFIQSYQQDDSKEEKSDKDYMDNGDIKQQFDQSFMFNYLALSSLSKTQSVTTEKKVISMTLSKVIESILDMNDEIMESKMKSVFADEFRAAQKNVTERNKKIANMFNVRLKKENERMANAVTLLK